MPDDAEVVVEESAVVEPAVAETPRVESAADPKADAGAAEKPATKEELAAAAKAAEEQAAQEAAEKAAQEAAERKARVAASVEKAKARMYASQRAQREAADLRQQLAAERAERTRLATLAKQYETEDPLAALERRGLTPEQLAQTIIKRGTPEEKIALLERQLEAKAQALTEKLSLIENQQREREFQAREAEARSFVVTTSAKNADRHELLMARFGSEDAIAAEVFRTAKAAWEKSGGKYSYPAEEVLAHLETETHVLRDRLTKAKSGSPKGTGTPESKVAGTAGQAGSRPAKSAPRTLTNGTASDSFTLPEDLDKLPEAKQNELLAEYLRRMTGASA